MNTKFNYRHSLIVKSPFILFAPFLLIYILIVFKSYSPIMVGDESVYLGFAKNLLSGKYSSSAPNINLGVGPGYPLILVPFVGLKLPLISIALFNAFLYYISIILIYYSLRSIVPTKIAIGAGLFWGLYFNQYENLQLTTPEVFMPFLVSLFVSFLMKIFTQSEKYKKYIFFAGLTFGFIILTKIIFGYVLLFMLTGNAILWILKRKNLNYKKGIQILFIATLTTIPYLLYTYQLTGRFFYWGTNGGNNLYWMSTPIEMEYGDWFATPKQSNDSLNIMRTMHDFRQIEYHKLRANDRNIPGKDFYLLLNHQKDLGEINKLTGVDQDDAFKRKAIENIRSNPVKYINNCICNASRILFNYPYSYKIQSPKTLIRFPLNGIILLFSLFSFILTIINWQKTLYPIRFAICIMLLYLGGSILGSAETRMFTVIVPILLIWNAIILHLSLKINWKFE